MNNNSPYHSRQNSFGPPSYTSAIHDEKPKNHSSMRLLQYSDDNINRPDDDSKVFKSIDNMSDVEKVRDEVDDETHSKQPRKITRYQVPVKSALNQDLQTSSATPGSPISPVQRSYQPHGSSATHSSALGEIPDIPPPSHTSNHGIPQTAKPWTPSRSSWHRPASSVSYEPEQINGSPRPGTPSSKYGGGDKRPLPPAPLFAAGSINNAPHTSIPIPHNDHEDDDVFTSFVHGDDGNRDDNDGYDYDDETEHENEDADDNDDDNHNYKHDSRGTESTITDDYDEKLSLYGPAPEGAQTRRGFKPAQMVKRSVPLTNGALVLENKIPSKLQGFLPRKSNTEFTHMRYTAVTCDPDDFIDKGYKLRQNYGDTHRETELFICITMYNEDEIHFTRTMHGVMRNIVHFCSRSKSRIWGKDGWQKIVVCIIADGRTKVHPRTLDALAAMGCYQDGIAKNRVNNKEVAAHVYEYTTQVSLASDLQFRGAEKGIVPCQMIFCLKEKNQKKLNSHRWFFNAFGRALDPNICILLDVGTKPDSTALYHLWKAFDTDSSVAGAAGEIIASKGKGWIGLFNPLVASQNFEYKISNILDKPLESVFGYITVLPGALSAYRYVALQNDSTGHGPLSQYFKGETLHGQNADVFTANMYLAEDRILCWELVAKRHSNWILKFVKRAKGETDVPDTVPEFVSQRRRWLNGAFFAAVYSLIHFRQVWSTDHSIGRKIILHIEFIYQFVQLLFTFFSLANFYLTFFFIAGSLGDPRMDPFGHGIGKVIFSILRYTCVLIICVQFILSMGNRPQGAKKLYVGSMVIYSIIMAYTTFAGLFIVVKEFKSKATEIKLGNNLFTNMIVSTASTIGLYFYCSFLYLDPWHMFTSSAQYFALLPSYICTLQVYAFCNTHDITWGTKGDNVAKTDLGTATGKGGVVELEIISEQKDIDSCYNDALVNLRDRVPVPEPPPSLATEQEDYYRAVRTYMVISWLVANAILAMAVSEAYGTAPVSNNVYLKFILWSVAAVALFRAVGSTTFAMLSVGHAVEDRRVKWSEKWFGWGSGGSAGGSVVSSATKQPSSVGVGGGRRIGGESSWSSKPKGWARSAARKAQFWKR